MKMPAPTARHFASYSRTDVLADVHRNFLIGRLLEHGDRADLRWLCRHVDEATLLSWLADSGARTLSRRSYRFWSLVLGSHASAPSERADTLRLWPL